MIRIPQGLLSTVLVFASISAVQPARAADIYNNLGATQNQTSSINNSFWFGLSFRTTATESLITSLSVDLQLQNASNTSGNVNFQIFDSTGASGLPGTVVSTAGSIALSSMTTSRATYTLNSLNIPLSTSTNYWLVLKGTTTDFVSSILTISTNGASGSIGAGVGGTGTWNLHSGYRAVGVVSAIAVPEPTTYALAAIAAGVMTFVARRRKARTA